MDQELKAKWVAALRSGKYQQTTGMLRESESNGFCCLGVLLDISGTGKWNDAEYALAEPDDEGSPQHCSVDLGKHSKNYGLTDEQQALLARMNDGSDEFTGNAHAFPAIADYIEKKL